MHKNRASIEEALTTARQLLAEQERKIQVDRKVLADLERKMRLARGTRQSPLITLEDRIVTLLRNEAMGIADLAAKVSAPAGRVSEVVARLRAAKRLHNIGSDVEPLWQCTLGDNGPVAELKDTIYRLISHRPFTFRELVVVTGARDNRVSGALTKLKEDPELNVVNLGDGFRGRRLALPPKAK